MFSEDGNDIGEDTSEDDGYLSEGSWCQSIADDESETCLEEKNDFNALAEQNRKIYLELANQKEKLDRLMEKDPKFSEFMESHGEEVEQFGIRDMDSVHLWATGQGTVSSSSFLIIRNVTEMFSTDCFSTCLIKSYKAFIRHCSIVEPGNIRHLHFLRDSLVDLWSMDVHKSMAMVLVSIQQLGKILMHGLQTKKMESLKTICSWKYINCVDLWVMFVSTNAREYDLQELVYMVIQLINGAASLFSGPRSSGMFIPVSSFVLDMMEYNIGKDGGDRVMVSDFSCALKLVELTVVFYAIQLPKNWLKSRRLQEDCVLSAIELLSVHFSLWSYHISFPELASIPLMRLKRFYEKTTTENLRRVVKRFIDQVDNNVVYVEKKREEVAFSPKDEQSVESFLQQEKCSGNTSFIKYYTSVIENATSRSPAVLG